MMKPIESSESIADMIRECVIRKYGSQGNAAKAWGVSQTTVSKTVNGHCPPSRMMMRDAGLAQYAEAQP
jgi:hypothetical protein